MGRCRRGRQRRARGHHVIDKADPAARKHPRRLRVHANGLCHVGEPLRNRHPVLFLRSLRADQRGRRHLQPRLTTQRAAKFRRLVIAPRQKPGPMRRHRNQQRIGRQKRCTGPSHPACAGRHKIQPVGMFHRPPTRSRRALPLPPAETRRRHRTPARSETAFPASTDRKARPAGSPASRKGCTGRDRSATARVAIWPCVSTFRSK